MATYEEGTHTSEPQSARGAPGSRNRGGGPAQHGAAGPGHGRRAYFRQVWPYDYTGVNPLGPIDPRMPTVKTGDQGG